jgi:putative membrane protein
MLFVWDGSVLKTIVPQLLLMLAISVLAVVTGGHVFGAKIPLDTVPFPLVGVSLAIFSPSAITPPMRGLSRRARSGAVS